MNARLPRLCRAFVPVALIAFTSAACKGGGSPAAPSGGGGPQNVTLTVVSAGNGQPVSGAKVIVNGASYTSGGDGRVQIPDLAKDTPLDVEGNCFVNYTTRYRSDKLMLVPLCEADGFDESFFKSVVFFNNPVAIVRRPSTTSPLTIMFSEEARGGPNVVGNWRAVSERLMAKIGNKANFKVDDSKAIGRADSGIVFVNIRSTMAGASTYGANYSTDGSGLNYVTSATLDFRDVGKAAHEGLIMHELTHVLGLQGHHSGSGLMVDTLRVSGTDFSNAEELALRVLFNLRPNTAMVHNDR